MTDWQKILLIRNLNKVKKKHIVDDYYCKRYYTVKDAIRDTFGFSGKSNTFKSIYNFFVSNEETLYKKIYRYGYMNGDRDVIEVNKVEIKIICKLQKVNND